MAPGEMEGRSATGPARRSVVWSCQLLKRKANQRRKKAPLQLKHAAGTSAGGRGQPAMSDPSIDTPQKGSASNTRALMVLDVSAFAAAPTGVLSYNRSMPRWMWLIFFLAALGALLLLGLQLVLERLRKRLAVRIQRRCPAGEILAMGNASFAGRRLAGLGQLRGNGVLLLQKDRLCFLMLWPERELEIPLVAITALSSDRAFLGRVGLKPFLIVDFLGEGGPDAVAFAVESAEGWIGALQELKKRRLTT